MVTFGFVDVYLPIQLLYNYLVEVDAKRPPVVSSDSTWRLWMFTKLNQRERESKHRSVSHRIHGNDCQGILFAIIKVLCVYNSTYYTVNGTALPISFSLISRYFDTIIDKYLQHLPLQQRHLYYLLLLMIKPTNNNGVYATNFQYLQHLDFVDLRPYHQLFITMTTAWNHILDHVVMRKQTAKHLPPCLNGDK